MIPKVGKDLPESSGWKPIMCTVGVWIPPWGAAVTFLVRLAMVKALAILAGSANPVLFEDPHTRRVAVSRRGVGWGSYG